MRRLPLSYFVEHLVEPGSLAPLREENGELHGTKGSFPIVSGVPVFSGLYVSPQWQDEMKQTAGFAEVFSKMEAPLRVSQWSEPWLRDEVLSDASRIVCIGGSLSDDVPHVTKGHKFNVDLFAHEYTKLPAVVMDLQDTAFVACWAEKLPFASQSVDFVYTRNALDHFESPITCVGDVHRVLKDDGLFILAVYYDSSFFDAHETGIVDDEFMQRVVDPLFEQLHRSFVDADPTGPVLRATSTRFMFYVGRKRAGAHMLASPDAIRRAQIVGSGFQKALYEREHHNGAGAIEFYQAALSVPPGVRSDAQRQLHSCLDLLAMTDREAMIAAAWHMRLVGIAANWAPIANLTLGRYDLDIETISAPDGFDRSQIACPPYFEHWKWLATLAKCVEIDGNSFEAASLAALAREASSEAAAWLEAD